jgi:hypothetical protein
MEELLAGRAGAMPKIYGWTHTDLKNLFNLAAYDTFPNSRSSQAGYDLGSAVLMPLFVKDFQRKPDGSVSGTPLPMDEAQKNARKLTLFGYSAGSIVAQETYNATLKMMKGVGYAEKDARKVLNNVVLIAVGTISRPSKEKDRFSTVCLVASNDRINRFKNWTWGTLGTALRWIFKGAGFKKNNKDLSIRPLSKTSLFISTSVRPSLYEWKYNDEGERIGKKPFEPLYPAWAKRRSYHELVHYVTTDDRNNGFSRIVAYSLANAVGRDMTPAPLDLLTPPANDTFGAEAQAAYRERIANALKPKPAALAR